MNEPKIRAWPCALHPESGHTKTEKRPRCLACLRVNRKRLYDAGKNTLWSVFSTWKAGAIRRGHSVDITYHQWAWITRQPCVYKIDETPAKSGIDRKDNHRGYVQRNCQPCCYRHNMVKGSVFTHTQMLDLVTRYNISCGDAPRRS
jgi:hypothetical protein